MTNTHILVNEFTYHEPVSLAEVYRLLLEHDAHMMAGGTDLLVHMKIGKGAPQHLVSLRRVPGLSGIKATDLGVDIGSMTTIAEVAANLFVREHFPALAEACDAFSTRQVESMGTIGGNIGNASPAADTAPALLAYGAWVVVDGPDGERQMPVGEFFVGPGRTALRRGEIITHIHLGWPSSDGGMTFGSAFLKMGRVAADIAKASAAAQIVRNGDKIVEARLAFGSVAPTPVRTPRAEGLLAGKRFSPELVTEAAMLAAEEVTPIDDVRSEAWYRREIVKVMAHDGLMRAWQRAGRPVRERDRVVVAPNESVARGVEGGETPPLRPGDERTVTLLVNGEKHRLWVQSNELLLNVLREKLQLTGSKYGCGIGECSACTVLMDGKPVLACLVLAVAAEGADIRTVEGLQAADGSLDPLQEAFIDHAAFQCGYCTPGMLMTAKSLLAEIPHPVEDEVRHYLRGNLCRCTGYVSIVRAVLAAANGQHEDAKTPVPALVS
jgi:xanthine dehydrogenase iron-sulfur cluster and FAD-binding subunit A